jgi:hypothetical protein
MPKAENHAADLERRLDPIERDLRAEIERLRKEGDRAWADGERLIGLGSESGHAARAQGEGLRQQADRLEGILCVLLDSAESATGD